MTVLIAGSISIKRLTKASADRFEDAPRFPSTAGCGVDELVGRYRPSGYNDR